MMNKIVVPTITYPYKPAFICGIICFVIAVCVVWFGVTGIVVALGSVASGIGSFMAAYTTDGCEKMTWEKEKTIIKNFIRRIKGAIASIP